MLHYSVYTKPQCTQWITFVHGAGGSSSIWYKQIKVFRDSYNVLLIDLRGHGNSKKIVSDDPHQKYTFNILTKDIIDVLNHLDIAKSHFVGISLGSVLIRNLAKIAPQYVGKMVLGGAILKLNLRTKILMHLGVWLKHFIPYMMLYQFFAFIIMPRKNHKTSRLLFVREAKKMCQQEFIRWFSLTIEVRGLLRFFRKVDPQIPTLYIMGNQDYLFLDSIEKMVRKQDSASLLKIENCGHVVNIEKPQVFNEALFDFLAH